MSFDLLREPWLPVIRTDGSPDALSLTACFTEAAAIRRIGGEIPTQSFALLRLLLAICHDAIGFHTIADLKALVRQGLDTERVLRYLDDHRDRFDLFHPDRPFFQVAGLRTTKGEASGLEKLISDVPNGFPFLTTRGGRALERISAAEAAVWLVHCHAFDPSGIRSAAVGDPETKSGKGYPIGPAWAGQIGGVIVHGNDLGETLAYNLTATGHHPDDRPVWALDAPQTEQRQMDPHPPGPVSLLVWQSRRIRLVGDRDGVTGVVLCQGDRLTPQNRHDLEPMTAWRYSSPQTKKHGTVVYMPLKHDPSRDGWRGLPAMVSTAPPLIEGQPATLRPEVVRALAVKSSTLDLEMMVGLEFVGMSYGPNEATVAEIAHDRLDLRLGLLGAQAGDVRQMIHDAVDLADRCVRELGKFAANVARASGDRDGTDGARTNAMTAAWAALDTPAREWLEGLAQGSDTVAAMREWQGTLRGVLEHETRSIADGACPAATAGRPTPYGFMNVPKAELILRKVLTTELPLAYPPTRKETLS